MAPRIHWWKSLRFSRPGTSACAWARRRMPHLRHTPRHVRPQNLRRATTLYLLRPRRESVHVWREVIGVKREMAMSPADLVRRLVAIQAMKTGELQREIAQLTGMPCRSFNKPFLQRKLAWLVQQAQAESKQGLPDGIAGAAPMISRPHSGPLKAPIRSLPVRDSRLPRPGTVLVRPYKGLRLTVTVQDRGFEWNGQIYPSLSALASAITGTHWNGRLFFGLSLRNRGSK